MNLGTAAGNYSFDALRINYSGEKTSFSVDLPADRCAEMILSDGTPIEVGDGTTGYDLFGGVSDSGYVSSAFHEGGNGYDGEIAAWDGVDGAVLYDGADADGQPFCMVRMDMLSAYLAEYPLEDGTWVNIMVSFPEEQMETMYDDVYNMFGTFSRETEPQSANNGVLNEGAPLGEYGMEARRVALRCADTELSIDIPAEYSVTKTYSGEPPVFGLSDIHERYVFLDAENGEDYMFVMASACLNGFERRKADLAALNNDTLEFSSDADGMDCAIMMSSELSGTAYHITAEYPCGDKWIYTVHFRLGDKPTDEEVSDIYAMLKTFSRSAAAVPGQAQISGSGSSEETSQPEKTDAAATDETADIPATGVGLPVSLITAAAGLLVSAVFMKKR